MGLNITQNRDKSIIIIMIDINNIDNYYNPWCIYLNLNRY